MSSQGKSVGAGQASDVTGGYETFQKFFPIINVVMYVFGWFTTPIQVFFRKDFGQRYYTQMNFFAGLAVLGGFNAWQSVSGVFSNNISSSYNYYSQNGHHVENTTSYLDKIKDHSLLIILVAYLLVGSYHFFRIWWRNRTNTALHSFEIGKSRFEKVAVYFMKFVNITSVPILRIYMLFLPKEERERKISVPPLINDLGTFTDTILEPMLLFVLAIFVPGTAKIWLLISAPAHAIYANWAHTSILNKVLDFRDAIISAKGMQDHKQYKGDTNSENEIIHQAAETIKNAPDIGERVKQQYPDLMSIIDDLNEEQL